MAKDNKCDYHVHCGCFHDKYYRPKQIIKALYKNKINEFWISSTTSCVSWNNNKEKDEILNLINLEMCECQKYANKYQLKYRLLYFVIPQQYYEGQTISDIMDKSKYNGFKIHPKINGWEDERAHQLMIEVCEYAFKNHCIWICP